MDMIVAFLTRRARIERWQDGLRDVALGRGMVGN